MIGLKPFLSYFLFLQTMSLTSYFKLKNEYRKVEKEIYFNIFSEESNFDKKKSLEFLKNSPFYIKEDNEYFYIKNEYDVLEMTYNNIKNFLKKFKKDYRGYVILLFVIPNFFSEKKILFDKNYNYLFPELIYFPYKKGVE